MSEFLSRRSFVGTALAVPVALSAVRAASANERVVVGIMGMGGRGNALAAAVAQQANVEIAYVCDPDKVRVGKAAETVGKAGKAPQAVADFRKILDDKSVDVLICAACNHWHAPATILACAAGKHVYVEKPCSHNPREGELMVVAARKHDRRVQMGNQRRSWPSLQEAVQSLREGIIGRVYLAQSWYTNTRPSIGTGMAGPAPETLDYALWQGPAPHKPFMSNYLHYHWHWFWHWGNGELGNNGVHMIDVCRWGLGVDTPTRVSSAGGRFRYTDDQETPDTQLVQYEFASKQQITWQGTSCAKLPEGKTPDVLFVGEKGTLTISGGTYTIYDEKGKETKKQTGPGGDLTHMANFIASVRGSAKLNSEIQEGHRSTLLCHLGNIAHRTGHALTCAEQTGMPQNDTAATHLWGRTYQPGFEPTV
jgi:predicted dehydrogenase